MVVLERELRPVEWSADPDWIMTAHLADPRDRALRTALCGERILGVEAFPPFKRCASCDTLLALFEEHRDDDVVAAILRAVFGRGAR